MISHTSSYTQEPSSSKPGLSESKSTFCREPISDEFGLSASAKTGFAPNFPPGARLHGSGGPESEQLMTSIREVAVFAWGIVGINRSLEQYQSGTPSGASKPEETMLADTWGNEAAAGRSWE